MSGSQLYTGVCYSSSHLRQGLGLVSYLSIYLSRQSSVSPKFSRNPTSESWLQCVNCLFSPCFEILQNFFCANSVTNLKLCFVFYTAFQLSRWKSYSDSLIYHTAQTGSCGGGDFSQFPFHVSIITSHCFPPKSRLLLHKGYVLTLCPLSITYRKFTEIFCSFFRQRSPS